MSKVTSDGSTASYYELPAGAKELQHLISYRNMNGQLAEIFRACYRYGIVSHSDQLRDAKKMVFYAMAEVERLEKWAPLAAGEAADAFDESRMDAIGQNGNDGLHYSEVHGNSHVPAEDMTDPRNWRANDVFEVVKAGSHGEKVGSFITAIFPREENANRPAIRFFNGLTNRWIFHDEVRFHHRPHLATKQGKG